MGKGAFLELLDAYKRGLSDATYTLMKMVLQPTPQNCLIMEAGPVDLVTGKIMNIEPFTLWNVPSQFVAMETCHSFSGAPPTSALINL